MNDTAGKARNGSNVVRIRAVWLDRDKPNSETDEFELPPTITVNTSDGRYHYYWLIQDDWSADESGRLEFRAVMKELARRYAGDHQVVDIARAMRLPGTFNRKRGGEHFVSMAQPYGPRYTKKQILKAFGPQVPDISSLPVATDFDDEWADEEVNLDEIRDALNHVSAVEFGDWLIVGMGLHHATDGSDEGYDIWDQWSQTERNHYDSDEQKYHWSTFSSNHDSPVTAGTIFYLARQAGWKPKITLQPKAQLPIADLSVRRRENDLAAKTIEAVRKIFRDRSHQPSEQHFAGLEHIAEAIQKMADRDLFQERHIYVSALPPGMGKTTTAVQAIRNLITMPEYDSVGVIYFLSRVEEIRNLVDDLGPGVDFSVIVSDNYPEKDLGNPIKSAARVMFTTQQMLASRLQRHDRFEKIPDFLWNGTPRQVRLWDESIVPFDVLTLNSDAIQRLILGARTQDKDVANELDQLAGRLKGTVSKTIKFPDLSVNRSKMPAWYSDRTDKEICRKLLAMSGREAVVQYRNGWPNTAIDVIPTLPGDIGPMVVLDASAELRTLYRLWHEQNQSVFGLNSPQKNYRGLTIHHWRRGAGKASRRDHGPEILAALVERIRALPSKESVLVIHHKPEEYKEPNWPEEISKRVDRPNVHFCNWGRHTATNDYKDCRHVVMIGVNRYPPAGYEAYVRGAKRLPANEGVDRRDLRDMQHGEIAHHVFQATCRGAVRSAVNGGCEENCHLYVICPSFVPGADTEETWQAIFPGAAIREWMPIVALQGSKQKAVVEVLLKLAAFPDAMIPKKRLRAVVDTSQKNLREILENPKVAAVLGSRGVTITDEPNHILVHGARKRAYGAAEMLDQAFASGADQGSEGNSIHLYGETFTSFSKGLLRRRRKSGRVEFYGARPKLPVQK